MTTSRGGRHVLVVAYHYPPDRAVGALRPARMAQAFRAAGHRVSVITARLPDEEAAARLAPDGTVVTTVEPLPSPRQLYLGGKRLVQRIRGRTNGSAPEPVRRDEVGNDRPVPLWKRAISALLWLPDDRQGFIPAAAAAARQIHAEHPIDLLITTAPPFSVHLAGLLIRRHTRARWIADFRDPWTDNPCRPAATRTAATDRLELWLERKVTRTADLVLSASEGIERFFAGAMVAPAKLLLVRNGIEVIRSRPPRPAGAPFRILHMGTFYHDRDPRPFLDALKSVRTRSDAAGARMEVTFIGASGEFNGQSVEAMIAERGLDDLVRFRGFVPRENAMAMAAESDLLLLLAQNQPDQVPQKLYEYLGTRVPILAFLDAEGESARLLSAAGGHYLVSDDRAESAAAALEAALAAAGGAPAGDPSVLQELTAAKQLQRLLDAVEGRATPTPR